MPGDESFALAFLGRVRVHDPVFSLALGRNNLALKRIVDLVSCSLASFISGGIYNETQNLHSLLTEILQSEPLFETKVCITPLFDAASRLGLPSIIEL